MLPLALPGVLTTVIYSVYITWNDYLIALIFNTNKSMSMLTVGLQNLALGTYGARWEALMAGSIISFVPVILLYAFLQQYFIRGITGSAVKE
jgi:multiple sugar transport system permease protein